MLRIMRRVRGGFDASSTTASDEGLDDRKRGVSPRRLASAYPAVAGGGGGGSGGICRTPRGRGGSRGQWWRGAVVGAASMLAACAIGATIVWESRAAVDAVPDMVFEDAPPSAGAASEIRCPVFNPVTGETTVPEGSPRQRIKTTITPKKKYPISSEEWAARVATAKAAKSQTSKGALPEEVGRSALSSRLQPRQHQQGQHQQDQQKRGGTAAVLTLLVADPKTPLPYISALGRPGGGSTSGGGLGGWEEAILCEEDASTADEIFRGTAAGGDDGQAWRDARERGAVKLVPCAAAGEGGVASSERLVGEVTLACAAADVSSSEWLWVPGPSAAEVLAAAETSAAKTGTGDGVFARGDVMEELSRLAITAGVDGMFGVRGWLRTEVAPPPKVLRARRLLSQAGETRGTRDVFERVRHEEHYEAAEKEDRGGAEARPARRRRLKGFKKPQGAGASAGRGTWGRSEKGGGDVWEFVGGADEEADGGILEVDALVDAIFVRGAHLKHACALLRGREAGNGGDGGSEAVTKRAVRTGRRRSLSTSRQIGEGKQEEQEGYERAQAQEEQEQQHYRPGRGLATEMEGDEGKGGAAAAAPGIKIRFMKLPAVSYVLRKTLGVRSFASYGLLPWGGVGVGTGTWLWGGIKGEEQLEGSEASVPGSQFLPWACLSPSSLEPVLLSVTSIQDLQAIKPLLVGFQDSGVYDPYIVLSGPAAAAATLPRELQEGLEKAMGGGPGGGGSASSFGSGRGICGVLSIGHGVEGGDGGGGSGVDDATGNSSLMEARWAALLRRVSPVAVLAVNGAREDAAAVGAVGTPGGSRRYSEWGETEGERAARRACHRHKEAEIAFVLLPARDAPHSKWLTRLAPVALASWSRPRFSVSVITNDRPSSLRRLLGSLQRSRLFGDEVAVDFYVESSADDETLAMAQNFSSQWGDRGLVQTHFRVLKGGLIRAVSESFFPSDRHHHGFLLEDDVEISPHFYAWAKWATLSYQYGLPSDFMTEMYGVSLYTPRVDELGKTRRVYDSNKLIASVANGAKFLPYLHQLPCSWGALYFPEIWIEYRLYLAARLREDHVSVNIDGSRTNHWSTSWKRFFIEMAYQAQYFMLYPNYYNQTSFATNWLELGEHIKVDPQKAGEDGKPLPPPPKGDSKHLPKDYTVPLMEDRASLVDPLPGRRLPALEALPRMDILYRVPKNK